MTCQSLDFQEILSIRWAKDDPNPIAQNSISMADKDALASFLNARGVNIEESGFNGPLDYANPEPKRVKLNDADVLSEYPELAYPDTDAQYAVSQYDMSGSAVQGVGSGVEVANNVVGGTAIPSSMPIVPTAAVSAPDYTSFFASLGGTYTASPSLNPAADHFIKRTVGQEECQSLLGDLLEKKRLLKDLALDCYVEAEENEAPQSKDVLTEFSEGQTREGVALQGEEKEAATQDQVEADAECEGEGDDDNEDTEEWTAHVDPESGATYYYNSSTGESSWGAAPTS
jgi:WW domain